MSEQVKDSKKKNQLLINAMGLEPIKVMYPVSNQDIEYTLGSWMKQNGIEVGRNSAIQIRCLLKSETTYSKDATKAGEKTNLPFIVVVFRQLAEGDYEKKNGVEAKVLNLVRKAMGNFQDRSQITLHNDDDLNSVLRRINYGHDIKWHIQPKKRISYAYIDPGAVLALCFGLPAKEIDNYTFDIVNRKLRSTMDRETRTRKFVMKILYGLKRRNNRPNQDVVNYMR